MSSVEIDTSFGYPLIRITDHEGAQEFFYPVTTNEFHPVEPRLMKGIPSIHHKDGWRITLFSPAVNPILPIVLAVSKEGNQL